MLVRRQAGSPRDRRSPWSRHLHKRQSRGTPAAPLSGNSVTGNETAKHPAIEKRRSGPPAESPTRTYASPKAGPRPALTGQVVFSKCLHGDACRSQRTQPRGPEKYGVSPTFSLNIPSCFCDATLRHVNFTPNCDLDRYVPEGNRSTRNQKRWSKCESPGTGLACV